MLGFLLLCIGGGVLLYALAAQGWDKAADRKTDRAQTILLWLPMGFAGGSFAVGAIALIVGAIGLWVIARIFFFVLGMVLG